MTRIAFKSLPTERDDSIPGPHPDPPLPELPDNGKPRGFRLHYLPRLFERESFNSDVLCSCGTSTGTFKCLDCFSGRPFCRSCLHQTHRCHPFHRIRHWISSGDGSRFESSSLYNTGFVLYLGHNGIPCESTRADQPRGPTTMTVVHTTGVHSVHTSYCQCPHAGERHEQLFDYGIFPATELRPQTGFSFQVLDHFHLLNLRSKMAAWDYWGSLVAMTDPVNPERVPVSKGPGPYNLTTNPSHHRIVT